MWSLSQCSKASDLEYFDILIRNPQPVECFLSNYTNVGYFLLQGSSEHPQILVLIN